MIVIENSRLFRRQKAALCELARHSHLPAASLQALGRRLLSAEELHYAKITSPTDLVARLGPMFGLMATLIPLGPGLIALGQGDTKTLWPTSAISRVAGRSSRSPAWWPEECFQG
jgi:biopolymer transport protein ExbB/TolQ